MRHQHPWVNVSMIHVQWMEASGCCILPTSFFLLCHSVSSCANGSDGKKVEEQVEGRNNIL